MAKLLNPLEVAEAVDRLMVQLRRATARILEQLLELGHAQLLFETP
jgi:hypothetical protein